MSSMNQTNGKKNSSGGSSANNTPVSTPASVGSIVNGQATAQPSPPPNNAPKYGTLVPNRIFVGGISANTTENELMQLFNGYGTVKAAKIIQDRAGVSKGYGFITFETEEDAKRLQRDCDNIVLRERKLNIAPAIKKQQSPLQPYSRAFDGASPPAVAAGSPQYYFPGSIPFFQGNVYYPTPTPTSGDLNAQQPPIYQAPTVYPAQSGPPQNTPYPPMIFPAQPMYMPQQYPMPMPYEYNYYSNGAPQYMVGGQAGPQSQVPPMQRPGSPPRQPCYSQQLPYTPSEAMYYNVPMYGTMEGPPVYQDGIDMPNGTPLPEEYTIDQHQQSLQDVEYHVQANIVELAQPCDVQPLHEPPSPPPVNIVSEQEHISTQSKPNATPVVSLLSDGHKVKDVTSMQSGRRRKNTADASQCSPSPTNNNNVTSPHSYNGFLPTNNYQGFSHAYAQPSNTVYNSYQAAPLQQSNFNVPPFPFNDFYKYAAKNHASNGYDRGGFRKRRTFNNERKSLESSSMSSGLRTESNSSASVADENRSESSENKTITTGVDTPPPAPYSPMAGNQYNLTGRYPNNYCNSDHRHYQQPRGVRGRNFTSAARRPTSSSHQPFSAQNNHVRSERSSVDNASGAKSNVSLVPQQVHAGSQHFIPPVRRARRSVRRNAPAINEIGAGDAPLPNSDVSDACKKLDSLKL